MSNDISEMGIGEMLEALQSGEVSSVDLVCAYLNRIGYYDMTGTCLNSIPIINPRVLEEAEASDERRRLGKSGPLEGIPFTVKDSYKVSGMTVASGSPAFERLVATSDAATVEQIREAGAVFLGKTNMPPMAAGGVQPGLYGYAKSPYHSGYLTAAYGSGSSNGSGTATAASLCGFSLAEETLSSGRSPASNNGLVAYTPSRGLISIRGNWPLFPTCDVVVPYTRTVNDLLRLLDIIVVEDSDASGDFWRSQKAVELPSVEATRPKSFLHNRKDKIHGMRLGIPRMFIGEDAYKVNPVTIRPSVRALWHQAAEDLVRLGAEVIPVDFPVVSNYEKDRPEARGLVERGLVHKDWEETEMGIMIALGWQEFLENNGMDGLSNLSEVDGDRVFPDSPDDVYANAGTAFDYSRLVELAKAGLPDWENIPGFDMSLRGLEKARHEDFEKWMDNLNLDAIVFPAAGDVGSAKLFNHPDHMDAALRNGVLFSNGNRVIRHLGIPTVIVPMGRMADISMPVGLTIAGRAYDDDALLDIAYAFEKATQHRSVPPLTPSIPSSRLVKSKDDKKTSAEVFSKNEDIKFKLDIKISERGWEICVKTFLQPSCDSEANIMVWVDGRALTVKVDDAGNWVATGKISSALDRLHNKALLVIKTGSHSKSIAHWDYISLPARELVEGLADEK